MNLSKFALPLSLAQLLPHLLHLTMPQRIVSEAPAASDSVAAQDIVATVKTAGTFNAFLNAIHRTALADTLKGAGPFTVFAPSNDAFADVPKEQLAALLADKAKLTKVLSRHVVAGATLADELTEGSLETVGEDWVTISLEDGAKHFGVAKVIRSDIAASNGIIHVIDTVLLRK